MLTIPSAGEIIVFDLRDLFGCYYCIDIFCASNIFSTCSIVDAGYKQSSSGKAMREHWPTP